jgi:hypothetical protein
MKTHKCDGLSANRRFETCGMPRREDGKNPDGTLHTCRLVLTAYAKRHPVKGGLSQGIQTP